MFGSDCADGVGGEQTEEMKAEVLAAGGTLMGIGKNCIIRKAIIDKNARIGDNVQVGGKSETESGGEGRGGGCGSPVHSLSIEVEAEGEGDGVVTEWVDRM